MLRFTQFVTFKEVLRKSAFLKITAQAFEAGIFLTFSKGFGIFKGNFLINIFLMKKNVYLACSEPRQTSEMELFVKIVNIVNKLVTIFGKSSILDHW